MENGWTIERDERGFWLVAGTVKRGPFERTSSARHAAQQEAAPVRRPEPQKVKERGAAE